MEAVFSAYLQAGLYGSVVIGLTALVRLLLRKAPRRILCLLWLLAAVRLLVPINLESAVSLQPDIPSQQIILEFIEPSEEPVPPPAETAPKVDAPQYSPEPVRGMDAMELCSLVWVAGMAAAVIYCLGSFLLLKRKVAEAVVQEEGVRECGSIRGPFLLGYFKPDIYIPIYLGDTERQFVIAHERMHILRGDNWWKLLGFFCACVHWYNPAVWVGYALLCRDIEIACDEQVVADMDIQTRKAYSLALLSCGKQVSGLLACPVAFGEVSLKQRIQNVLSYRRPGVRITGAAVLLTVIVAVCFLTTPKAAADDDPPTVPTAPTETEAVTQGETTAPEEETTVPAEVITMPAEETTAPTEAVTPPAEETTAPTEAVTPPAVETTAPTEAVTPPTEETTASTEEATAPSGETEPAEEENDGQESQTGIVDSGILGDVTQWQLGADGVLTISGTFFMLQQDGYPWAKYADQVVQIVIADEITLIPSGAFANMHQVCSVHLGSGMKYLEYAAFENCSSLQSIVFPASVTGIGANAFANSGIRKFVSPALLQRIETGAFENCTSLGHLVLGASVTELEDPFVGCTAIHTVEVYTSKQLYTFRESTSLRSVVIGGNLAEIGEFMFFGCSGLSSAVVYAPVDEIGQYAFANCGALAAFQIPDGVKKIGTGAFGNSGLTQIVIPGSVKEIWMGAFADTPLTQIVFLGDAPDMLTSTAFSGVTATAYYPADNPTWTEAMLQNYGGSITWIPR